MSMPNVITHTQTHTPTILSYFHLKHIPNEKQPQHKNTSKGGRQR